MRKTLIRTLTFVFGLYFVLEFLLPKELGGNFDKTALHAPAVLYDADSGEYRMYYVGVYNRRTQAVGLATSKDGVSWEKYKGNPVLRSTLFNSADRLGFSSLCPIKIDGGYELYYLGHDMETPPRLTICWATSSDGSAWEKQGRLEFKGEIPWRQHDELDDSVVRRKPRYTKLQAMAATVSDGKRVLFIAHTNSEGRTELLQAERTGTNGEWVVLPDPLPLTGLTEVEKITCLTYLERDGDGELWMYLSDQKLCRARLGGETMPVGFILGAPNGVEEPEEQGAVALAKITDMSVFAAPEGYRLVYSKEHGKKTAEDEVAPTELFTISSLDGNEWSLPREPDTDNLLIFLRDLATRALILPEAIIPRGAASQPTYLSHAFGFMGTVLSVIAAFAIGLGGVNMAIMQGRRVARGGKGVHNNVLFFLCFVFMFTATIWGKPIIDKVRAAQARATTEEEARESVEQIRQEHSSFTFRLAQIYDFVFYNVQVHLGATLFALVSFYMVGAAFRSFRVKSAEAGFLILSATIVLLGQIPLGAQLSPWLPIVGGKLLTVFNAAAYRAVLMGMAIAAISVSVRLWLGLEKGMFHGT